MAYRAEDRRDRWKAIAATAAINLLLGAVILSGLNVDIVSRAVDRLETFDISLPKPPPEEPPPPPPKARDEEPEGAPAAPKASPVVAPKPVIELPPQNPMPAAPVAGTGSSSSTGQGGAGSGTGAGGSGAGTGSGAGNSPARLVRNLTRADYRSLTANRLPEGSASLALRVDAKGQVDSCRIIRSSGDSIVDSGLCALAARRLRFAPARDPLGRPISYFTNYTASWRR